MGEWRKVEEKVLDYLRDGTGVNQWVNEANRRVLLEYIFIYDYRNDLTIQNALRCRGIDDIENNRRALMKDIQRPTKFYYQYTFYDDQNRIGGDAMVVSNTDQLLLEILEEDQPNT